MYNEDINLEIFSRRKNMIFNKGDKVALDDGRTAVVNSFLGAGGQGEVYLASVDGEDFALKWYLEKPESDFVSNLKSNIQKGSPSKEFLFPKVLTKTINGNIGYLMDVRPQNYRSFVSYLNGKARFKSLTAMIDWCINLSRAFKSLHQYGYAYQDLNDGSFFFDEETGDALICDNDNITATGCNLGILGKMKYMAPEVVMSSTYPDVHSDRFSLAVVLFLCLCLGHPFEGAHMAKYNFMDEVAELEMYGSKPMYVFNKNETSNRPIRGYHNLPLKRYPLLPTYLADAFHKTFVDGLTDRENSRTTELEWIKVLSRYRDELVTCSKCAFSYAESLNSCPKCSCGLPQRLHLSVNKNIIALEPKKKVYETHIDKYSPNYDKVFGEVIANKNNPNLWGIRNLSSNQIEIIDGNGNSRLVAPNGVVPIIKGLQIKFNANEKGEIV